jgi:hypothetical protein
MSPNICSHEMSLNSAQVSETQPSLLQIQVTGTYLCDTAQVSTDFFFFIVSPQGEQPSPYQIPPVEKNTVLCYCNRQVEVLEDAICAECGATRGVERGYRSLVRNFTYSFLLTTKSLAALFTPCPALQSLFMQKVQYIKTSLLEGRRSPVNPSVVRLLFRFLSTWLSILHIELDIILNSSDGHAGRQTESATLLTITVSATNASASLITAVNTANSATADQDSRTLDNQTAMLSAALSRAEDSIDTMETWSSAVDVIKQVVDAVSPIAAVCPYIIAYSYLG